MLSEIFTCGVHVAGFHLTLEDGFIPAGYLVDLQGAVLFGHHYYGALPLELETESEFILVEVYFTNFFELLRVQRLFHRTQNRVTSCHQCYEIVPGKHRNYHKHYDSEA